jgi:hypothetical protein
MGGLFNRTRTVYLETADDRKALKLDDKAYTDSMPDCSVPKAEPIPLTALAHFRPELQSLEAFIEDNDTGEFTPEELQNLCMVLRQSSQKVRAQLEGYGLKLQARRHEREVRGIKANSHDLWMPAKTGPRIPETATSKATLAATAKLQAARTK